jgi:hypothetical protein
MDELRGAELSESKLLSKGDTAGCSGLGAHFQLSYELSATRSTVRLRRAVKPQQDRWRKCEVLLRRSVRDAVARLELSESVAGPPDSLPSILREVVRARSASPAHVRHGLRDTHPETLRIRRDDGLISESKWSAHPVPRQHLE